MIPFKIPGEDSLYDVFTNLEREGGDQEENKTLPGFIRVRDPDRIVGNVDHGGVFYFVDGVATDVGHLSAFGDQHNIVAFEESHKPCRERGKLFIWE